MRQVCQPLPLVSFAKWNAVVRPNWSKFVDKSCTIFSKWSTTWKLSIIWLASSCKHLFRLRCADKSFKRSILSKVEWKPCEVAPTSVSNSCNRTAKVCITLEMASNCGHRLGDWYRCGIHSFSAIVCPRNTDTCANFYVPIYCFLGVHKAITK